jgi:hypothetical protein
MNQASPARTPMSPNDPDDHRRAVARLSRSPRADHVSRPFTIATSGHGMSRSAERGGPARSAERWSARSAALRPEGRRCPDLEPRDSTGSPDVLLRRQSPARSATSAVRSPRPRRTRSDPG